MSNSTRRRLATLIGIVLIAAESGVVQAQCSMCRTLLGTPEGERIAAALRSGIWILLAAPLGVFAVIAVAAMKSRTRIEALRQNSQEGVHEPSSIADTAAPLP